MKNLIQKILRESTEEKFINLIIDKLKSGQIKPPYFKTLKNYGLDDDEIEYVLGLFIGGEANLTALFILNDDDDVLYKEDPYGNWYKSEYDERGNKTHFEDSEGNWFRKEYDKNNKEIYFEDRSYWVKRKFNVNGKMLFYQDSEGYWEKNEYNKKGELIYKELSDAGVVVDRR